MKLGVNVDHAATLRQCRNTVYPDPVACAMLCQQAGADSIVMHLREDRRHIQEHDLLRVREEVSLPINMEMAANPKIVDFAVKYKPFQATLVPERRQELTTEGGLDVVTQYKKIFKVTRQMQEKRIKVSLFIAPDLKQLDYAKKIGAEHVEFHTGHYCDSKNAAIRTTEFNKLKTASAAAKEMGFFVAAGHGINYINIKPILSIHEIEELNIGHAIVARALYVGMAKAVEEMMRLLGR